MSADEIVAAVRGMLMLTLLLATPFLAAATLSSLVVGLLQASTRINDLTLSFVPRFAVTLLAVYFASTWAIAQISAFIERSTTAVRAFGG